MSADAFNSARDDVLVAAITSQIPAQLAPDEFIIPAGELAACGLPKPSILRLSKMVALHQQLAVNKGDELKCGSFGIRVYPYYYLEKFP